VRLAMPRVKSLFCVAKEKDEVAGRKKEEEKAVRLRIGCLIRKDTRKKKQSDQVTLGSTHPISVK